MSTSSRLIKPSRGAVFDIAIGGSGIHVGGDISNASNIAGLSFRRPQHQQSPHFVLLSR